MTEKTVLNATHRALGARMVDFGGWDMPINYGSQIEEHHAVRRGAGMFDVSHMTVVDLHGARAREFLRHLLANNIDKLKVQGKALYSCMLNEQGGVIDDLIVYFLGDEHFRLVVNAGTRAKDLAWLDKQAGAFGVEVKERPEYAMIAVQGPQARAKVLDLLHEMDRPRIEKLGKFAAAAAQGPHGMPLFVARTGYTGEDGFEIIVPQEHALALWEALQAAGVTPAGLGARDTLRLEAGMNLYGQDMDEDITPWEAGLAWTVALDWFYADVVVQGRERLPRSGPLLIVANHPNALVDAMVVAVAAPRRVLLTASGGPFLRDGTNLIVAINSYGVPPNCTGGDGAYRVDQPDDVAWFASIRAQYGE